VNIAKCVGGVLSPLLANIALQVLDEHLQDQWRQLMGNEYRRARRRRRGLGTWRIVRYADDFVVLVFGSRENVESVRDEIAAVLAGVGLRLSPTKTQIVHMSEGFDFLGFHIQWRRKFGTDKWHVYTFVADRPVRQLKDKIRALTRRTSQQNLRDVLIRLGLIMRGWANYFKYAVCKHVFRKLAGLTWWRVIKWQMQLHRWKWKDVRRWLIRAPISRHAEQLVGQPTQTRPLGQPNHWHQPGRRHQTRLVEHRSHGREPVRSVALARCPS
jgi:RNA-directed DNA polymerase